MCDDAPGPSRGRRRLRKYALAEEARAARNASRRNRHWEEAAMNEDKVQQKVYQQKVQQKVQQHMNRTSNQAFSLTFSESSKLPL